MSLKYVYEYRINKKGAEYYRTSDRDEAYAKLAELNAKKPGVYTMQHRSCRLNKVGDMDRDWKNEINWTPWL